MIAPAVVCQSIDKVEAFLMKRYGEQPVFAAPLSGERGFIILYYNIDTGTYHIGIEPKPQAPEGGGTLCLRAHGTGGELYWPQHNGNPA